MPESGHLRGGDDDEKEDTRCGTSGGVDRERCGQAPDRRVRMTETLPKVEGAEGTPTGYRTKLIEVALPLEAINVASAREKSIRHGHPSTLHLWWARRPLATCRAVLFAQMVDD